jgi:pimeloyl-ACP methyl ester carboxylesterase
VLMGGGAGGPSTARPPLGEAARAIGAVVSDSARHRRPWPAAALFSPRFRAEHPDRVAAYLPYFTRHRAAPWMTGWQTLAAACFGRAGSLRAVRAPALVLHGGLDVMSPPANARLLADGIPHAELHLVAGAGHAVPLEHPHASARLLLEWVRRHADTEPPTPAFAARVAERLTRPLALHTGTLRNTRDAAALARRRVLSRRRS